MNSSRSRAPARNSVLTASILTGSLALLLTCGIVILDVPPETVDRSVDGAAPSVDVTVLPRDVDLPATLSRVSSDGALRLLQDGPLLPVRHDAPTLADLTNKEQKKLAKAAKKLAKKEEQHAELTTKTDEAQQAVDAAAAALAAAQELADGTPEEQKARAKAIKKALKQQKKADKKLAKATKKLAKNVAKQDHLVATIETLDPDYFGIDTTAVAPQLSAQSTEDQILFQWSVVDDADHYTLYVAEVSGAQAEDAFAVETTATSYLFPGLPSNFTMYGMVTATKDGVESEPSSEITARTLGPLLAPENLAAQGAMESILISFDEVPNAASYNLYWDIEGTVSPASGSVVAGIASPFLHTGLAPGTTYYYVVTSQDAEGDESDPSVTRSARTVPAEPYDVAATVEGTDAVLTWQDPMGAEDVHIFWDTEPDVTRQTGTPAPDVTSPFVHPGLEPGETRYYIVVAANESGLGPASDEVEASLAATLPAPASVTAVAGDGSVGLSWDPVEGAAGYQVNWSTVAGQPFGDGVVVDVPGTAWLHDGLTNGTTYAYQVATVNQEGATGEAAPEATAIPMATTTSNSESPLGMNISYIAYWTPEWVFTDAFKASKEFMPEDELTLDENGYPILGPGETATTLMYRDIQGAYPDGTYVCLYDGQGTVVLGGDVSEIVSSEPGRIEFRIDEEDQSDNGIMLQITSTPNPSDHVRNIRVMVPDPDDATKTTSLEGTDEIFHPLYLERLAPFSVIRFMAWQRTNDQTIVSDWDDNVTMDFQTQATDRGCAPELMALLCNELDADAWICTPHLATDDYVRQLAIVMRDTLEPHLKVYIEHSNEVWNGVFVQQQYAYQQALARGIPGSSSFQQLLRYHSERSVEIFEIFEDVFGGTERLMRTLAMQGANPWTGEQVMEWQDAYLKADVLSGAPYWGHDLGDDPAVLNMTSEEILEACEPMIDEVRQITAQNVANATAKGLVYSAYEGGQHMVGKGSWINDLGMQLKFNNANRHAAIYDLYMRSFRDFEEVGGGINVTLAFATLYSKYGSWGVLEEMDQPIATAPKYRACLDFIAEEQAQGGGGN